MQRAAVVVERQVYRPLAAQIPITGTLWTSVWSIQ